jgi:hypothetical protein
VRIALSAAAIAAAGLLVACSANETAPQQTSTQVAPAGHGSLAHCLGEHGVPAAPGPAAGPPPGVDPDTWHKAMQSCSTLAPGPAS